MPLIKIEKDEERNKEAKMWLVVAVTYIVE